MNPHDLAARPALSPAEIRVIMIGLMTAMFPGALDATIIGPAMPTIGRELGDVANLSWIATSYLLVSTAVTPLYGKLSDIHGRRIMLLIAIGLFALGSVLCALSPSIIALALARGVQGLGGGGLVSLAMTVIGDVISPRDRPRYQVYTSVMWTTANLLGPIAGGYFAEIWNWTLIFWLNLPICLVAYVMTDSKLKALPRNERPHRLDYPGALLIVIASGLLQLTLNWGGTHYAWSSSTMLALMAAATVFVAAFIWRLAAAEEPLIPYRLLSNRIILTGATSVGVTMAIYVGLTIYVPVFLENVRGLSASQSGLALLPLMVFSVLGAMTAGRVMIHVKRYKFVSLIGLGVAALGLVPMFIWPMDLSIFQIEIVLGVVSTGVGAVFPTTTVSIQNSVARHDLGTAMSLITFMRNLGAAAGVALFGAIIAGLAPSLDATVAAETFRWVFLVGALGYLLALILLIFMDERVLNGASGALR